MSANGECPEAKRRRVDSSMSESEENSEAYKMNEMSDLHDQLRQFDVLDEVQGDESGSDDSGGDESSETELDDDEIENMLDEGLPDDLRSKKKEVQYEEKYKTVLEEKGHNHFEVLPEGWVQVTHNSGLPIYLHKTSRVCTISRPYFLGPGSVRKHQIPISAIPCLNYKKALEKEELLKQELLAAQQQQVTNIENGASDKCPVMHNGASESRNNEVVDDNDTKNAVSTNGDAESAPETAPKENQSNEQPPKPTGLGSLTTAKIETVTENLKAQSLTVQQINDYCKALFIFKNIRVMRFKSWSARRKFTKSKKHIKNLQRPTLPDGTKLITFPVLCSGDTENPKNPRPRREWIMNPNGKSYVCILHEYVQHALKKQPTYEFKELENAATPYSATVSINDLKYGTGFGTSKKQAKSEAARETLEILIPEMRDKITAEKNAANPGKSHETYKDLSVFDEIRIEDPRVAEFCAKTTEPSPHAILTTCLQRNYGLGDIKINYQVNASKHKKNEFTMTVGKHTATVVCRNKRDGKQRAAQAILQILHPEIKTWGSLLRLYGNHSVKSFKEKKQEEQEITVLQSKAAINQPNYAILDKLKLEMTKLMEVRAAIQPIGTFVPPPEVDLPLASGSNLKNVEL